MEPGICYVVGAGEFCPRGLTPGPGDLVIAADGGYGQLKQWGMSPHLAVGDFDSLGRVPEDVEVVRHPVRKDDTDMMLAVQEGLARGCGRFLIYGGLGGRQHPAPAPRGRGRSHSPARALPKGALRLHPLAIWGAGPYGRLCGGRGPGGNLPAAALRKGLGPAHRGPV